jgi:hypothetical protein
VRVTVGGVVRNLRHCRTPNQFGHPGDGGRLVAMFIDDAVRTSLANLGLEKKINQLSEGGQRSGAGVTARILRQHTAIRRPG